MTDLVEFLRARLTEDEQTALAVPVGSINLPPAHWSAGSGPLGEGWVLGTKEDINAHSAEAAEHIARHDPARIVREVQAKRRLLDQLYPEIKGADEAIEGEWNRNPYNADGLLELLALPYANHPQYREEWRP
ncbi:DUF6221 family protein [Actinoallomurus spadix]|uniref:Uncharacterized protein n=1 Tax=Actinoallomurus spadix TaxID=79912 RepID=A0ABN0WWP1_9ACTN|nr:DUF6221 family protein [Actinoallomurus spadix]MCO5986560.1 DUF6221 family protein [Actinoallomurus spadix]